MKHSLIRISIVLLLLCLCIFGISAQAVSQNYSATKIVKVGFPIFKNFTDVTSDGVGAGYTAEYLNEISKYTGWEYEFIPKEGDEIGDLIGMLQNGEIDILGGIVKNEQTSQIFEFPEFSYGTSYTTLVVPINESRFSDGDYHTFDGMKVGLIAGAKQRLSKLNKFCASNGIEIETAFYDSNSELEAALWNGEIDSMLSDDLLAMDGVRVLTKFAAEPYYFAVSPNNTAVTHGLNSAISTIKKININYDAELHAKYFPENELGPLVLTETEKEFIAELAPLKVVSGFNTVPLDYFDKKGNYVGVTAEIFKNISESTGIKFEFIRAKNQLEAQNLFDRGEADIITGIYGDSYFEQPKNLTLLDSIFLMPMTIVKRSNTPMINIGESLIAYPVGRNIQDGLRSTNIFYADDLNACIIAVENGDADYCYGNSYSVEYYKRLHNLNNLDLLPMIDSSRSLCFAMQKPADSMLLGILNNTIRHISDGERQQIIFNCTSKMEYPVSISSFITNYALEAVILICVISALVIIIIIASLRGKRNAEKQFAKRYRILSDLADEILFEYDYKHDYLKFSEKRAADLGMEAINYNYLKRLKRGELYHSEKDVVLLKAKNFTEGGSKTAHNESECSLDFQWIFPDNSIKWFRAICVLIRGNDNKPLTCMGKIWSIEAEIAEKNKLVELAHRDGLTGLYNKSASEMLSTECFNSSLEGRIHAFMMVDLDDFKNINDKYGHKCGDETLKLVANILQNPFRSVDIIGRIGGDEFLIIARDLHSRDLMNEKCQVILEALSKPHIIDGNEISLSCSIGISFYPDDGCVFNELYKKADAALYQIKRNGKHGYCFYDASISMPSQITVVGEMDV